MNQRIEVTLDTVVNEGLFKFSFPYGAGVDFCLEALQQFSDQVSEMKANLLKQEEERAQQGSSSVDNLSTD